MNRTWRRRPASSVVRRRPLAPFDEARIDDVSLISTTIMPIYLSVAAFSASASLDSSQSLLCLSARAEDSGKMLLSPYQVL